MSKINRPALIQIPSVLATVTLITLLSIQEIHAKCNGWHSNWCGDHYWRELNDIKKNILPSLNVRAAVLPVQISGKNHERDLIAEMIRGTDREITLYNALLTKDQGMVTLLNDQLIPAARDAEIAINALNGKITAHLPKMVIYLRNFLTKQSQTLEARLQELNSEIASLTDFTQMEALLFEKAHLENLQSFSQNFTSQEAFYKALNDVTEGRFDAKTAKLSMETVTLLKEAADLRDLNETASSLLSSMRAGTQKLLGQLQAELGATENAIAARKTELNQVIVRKQAHQAQYHEINQLIDSLQTELNNIPKQIENWKDRYNNADLYLNCCDNEPFCHHLPDANQDPSAYARFETSISRPHHEGRCNQGGDL